MICYHARYWGLARGDTYINNKRYTLLVDRSYGTIYTNSSAITKPITQAT